ncbi:MAG: hypothetical protein WCB15_22615 [Desulfobacterales bacterium]
MVVVATPTTCYSNLKSGQTVADRIGSSITIVPQTFEIFISLCPADIWLSTKIDQLFDDAVIDMNSSFYSIYSHGFIRVAVAIPSVRVADCANNVERTLHLASRASDSHTALILFPELGISAYSNEVLFHQDALLDDVRSSIASIKTESRGILPTIKKWLEVFLYRFFKTSQFKRSALPNAPKVGSGGSLSPRADWQAPSDSEGTAWLKELEENVPD